STSKGHPPSNPSYPPSQPPLTSAFPPRPEPLRPRPGRGFARRPPGSARRHRVLALELVCQLQQGVSFRFRVGLAAGRYGDLAPAVRRVLRRAPRRRAGQRAAAVAVLPAAARLLLLARGRRPGGLPTAPGVPDGHARRHRHQVRRRGNLSLSPIPDCVCSLVWSAMIWLVLRCTYRAAVICVLHVIVPEYKEQYH
uniref:Uncharacterized protein n=1 Tax=Aegilops tauschii subsp. strangulata TaxID=200361 RepID=A0A453TD36_AEGTS